MGRASRDVKMEQIFLHRGGDQRTEYLEKSDILEALVNIATCNRGTSEQNLKIFIGVITFTWHLA